MLKNWNWKHYLVWTAFLLGFAGAVLTVVSNMPAGSSPVSILVAVVSFGAIAVAKFSSFIMNPPSDPADAFKQGESALAGVASKRGFARLPLLFVLASVCIVFAFLRPSLQRHERAALSTGDPIVVQAEGCAFWQHEAPVLKQDAVVDVPCVLAAVLGGGGGSLAACGVTSAAQLGGVLGDLIAFYDSQRSDAGMAGAERVPFKGIPATLSDADLARLKAYKAQVDAAAAGGK